MQYERSKDDYHGQLSLAQSRDIMKQTILQIGDVVIKEINTKFDRTPCTFANFM